ncbi:Fur family transcriptional regulator [Parendozoicomonas haliclonae]|uniref:Zinc uptake regulation protein n=1 Tax=Parendozoicomonas haliclonae TaxID=1960125 RepID=A0A1X7AJN5_9GAMM|nr:Fur family transcriptional regulator [Parendozoicomonas haliclonae]SMA46247.1 Zinc uptake regulation protein [Parendozoicomonas haliclonae]
MTLSTKASSLKARDHEDSSGSQASSDLANQAYTSHDHSSCVSKALEQATELCQQRGQRLTALRKQVLELVWDSHKPIGAYDILAMMSKDQDRPAAPPTVYRALDFLLEQSLIHRIASLNAYIGCHCPDSTHEGIFLICEKCRTTRELTGSEEISLLKQQAANTGFQATHSLVEISGLCPACQPACHEGA